jgi:hypothetical protein
MEEVKEKKCFKCCRILPINNFYKHKKMLDGHLNKCIECTKNDVRNRESFLKTNPIWIEQEKKRHRDKYYRLEYKNRFKPSAENKKEAIRRYNQKFPEKALARKYTEIYLTKIDGINLHHWSYNQEDWLDVIELTIKEHSFLHRFIIYDQERMLYRDLENVLLDTKEKHIDYYEKCKQKYDF